MHPRRTARWRAGMFAATPAGAVVFLFVLNFLFAASSPGGGGGGARIALAADDYVSSEVGQLGWTDSYCGSCHRVDQLFSHPVGVIPSMRVPDNMPLDNGRITCATCHDNSQSSLHGQARTQHTAMLRNNGLDSQFCAQCHSLQRRDRVSAHGNAMGKAHLQWPGQKNSRTTLVAGLDDDSRNCLSCHDGSLATDIGVSTNAGNGLDSGMGSHPVGIISRVAAVGKIIGRRTFTPHSNDPRIRLFDNTIGCGSCHSPYSTQPKLLVMSNFRSQLCLSCHTDLR